MQPITYTETTGSFLYSLGQACNTEYGGTGSSTQPSDLQTCLERKDYHVSNSNYSDASLISEMNAGRPTLLFGRDPNNPTGGHVWVACGLITERANFVQRPYTYTRNHCIEQVHVNSTSTRAWTSVYHNFGWGGDCDGYYSLNLMEGTPNIRQYKIEYMFNHIYPN